MKDIVETLSDSGPIAVVAVITTVVGLVVTAIAQKMVRKGQTDRGVRPRAASGIGAKIWRLSTTPMFTAKVPGWGQWVEKLQMTVRAGCGVPIVYSRVEFKLASLVRLIRLNFFIHDTSPKPAFEIASWGYHPVAGMEMGVVYNLSEGFILHIELAEGELVRHLKKSIEDRAQLAKTMIVLVPLESLYDMNAPVRCFLVDTSNVGLDDRNPKKIAFASAIPNSNEQQPALSMLNGEVPPRAVRLVCDDPNAKEPNDEWWAKQERGKASPRITNESCLEYVNLTARRLSESMLGLVVVVFLLLPAMFIVFGLVVPDIRYFAWPIVFLWGFFASYFLFFILGGLVLARVRSWYRLRAEKTTRKNWHGRTTRCIAAGKMVQGVALSEKKWAAIFEVLDQ